MYHNVSRGASPSATAPRACKIDLENIEDLQDAWGKKYEMLRDPPPPPQLNSPRSLRACAMAEVNPQYTLQKLSLKQHLFRVLGNATMLSALPQPSTTEYRVLMQSALRSFQEATIGLGTSQEKLAAFIAYSTQEELRGTHLASLRELRRQLVAEEVFEERKRHHGSRRDAHRRPPTSEAAVSVRSGDSVTRRRRASSNSAQSFTSTSHNALWSLTVEEEQQQTRSSRRASLSSQADTSAVSALGNQLVSPVSTALSGVRESREPAGTRSAQRTAAAAAAPSASPPSNQRAGTAEMSFTALSVDVMDGAHGSTTDFTPTVSPSGKRPYTPRDVSSLNSSYFGNRSIQSNVSNPSGAVLPATSANASVVSPAPKRPVLAQKSSLFQQKQQQQQQPSRRPLVPPPPQPPAQNLNKALSDSIGDADREMSIGTSPQDHPGLESVPKQDLSVVSLNSNQLDLLLNPTEPQQTTTSLTASAKLQQAQQQERTPSEAAVAHPVQLFHAVASPAATPGATTAASAATATAKPTLAKPAKTSSSSSSPSVLVKANASGNAPGTAAALATTKTASASTAAGASATSNQPLTPRGRKGYTNHLNSPTQLVPNVYPRNRTPLPSSNVSVSDQTPTPEDRNIVTPGAPHAGVVASPTDELKSTRKSPSPSPATFYPPAITRAEQEDGFVYYCANPTRSVTKFYGGARFPIAGAVNL